MAGGGTPYKWFSGKGSGLFHDVLNKLPGGWGEKVRIWKKGGSWRWLGGD